MSSRPQQALILIPASDILSHYKEIEAGDDTTYVICHAKVHRQTNTEAIRNLIIHMAGLMERIRVILGEGKALEAFEGVVAGFAQYHLQAERYRLAEILPEYYS